MLDDLYEGATQAFKRKNQQITRYYRCTSGPKKGKLASDPSKCGMRPDPKRVRHGRRVAKQKGAIRVRKTATAKRQQISKRITQLNRNLRNRRMPRSTPMTESFSQYLLRTMGKRPILDDLTEQQLESIISTLDIIEQHMDNIVNENALEQTIMVEDGQVRLYDMVCTNPGVVEKRLVDLDALEIAE